MERFDLDHQSFHPFLEDRSGYLLIIVPGRNLADQPAESEDRRALGFIHYEKKGWSSHYRKCLHATPY